MSTNYSSNKFNNKFSIIHHNVQHLPSRQNLLEICLSETKPDIIALSEHKMTSEEIELLYISNYVVASHFSRELGRGGGVVILTKDNLV